MAILLISDTLRPDDNLHYEKFTDGTIKCIEDEIPFNVPDGWIWTRLGCITDVIQYGLSNSAQAAGDFRLLRITDIQDGYVNWDSVPFTSTNDPQKYLLKKGDIVFARTGATVGKSFLISDLPYNSVYASYLIRISLINDISANYIYQFFNSHCYWNQITGKSVGVGQPNCNGTSLRELFIPLPPQEEQNRIVPAVDESLKIVDIITTEQEKLFELINITKSKILDLAIRGKLVPQDSNDEPASILLKRIKAEKEEMIKQGKIKRNKKESVIFKGSDNSYYRSFSEKLELCEDVPEDLPISWEWTNIGSVFSHNTGKALNSSKNEGQLLTYITTSNLYWNEFVLSNLKSMFFTENELEKCTVKKGDLLVCEGGDIGRSAIWNFDNETRIQNHIHRLRAYNKVNVKFYYYILYLYKITGKINGNGIGLQGLSSNTLHSIEIPLPPFAEQARIVEAIERIFAKLDEIANQVA